MRTKSPPPQAFLPLPDAVFHILLALAGEERHGYGIMQEAARRSGGKLRLGPGTLYGALKRMLSSGLIVESDRRRDPSQDDARRRYYRMTPLVRRVVAAEAERLAALVKTARSLNLLSPSQQVEARGAR